VTAGTVSAVTPVTLTASYSGVNVMVAMTINPPALALSSITVSPVILVNRQSATGMINLTAPASSTTTVSLSSSNPTALNVPSSVKLQKGSATATFSVKAGTVSSATTVTVTGTYSGVIKTFTMTVNP
jgi:hypothetical protein